MPRLPYTNFHDLNLNWFLKEFKKIIESVSKKQDAPAQPGTAGQVLGLGPNQTPVWLTPQGGGGDVTDVKIDQSSIVDQDGVANIPIASANDPGVIKIAPNSGVALNVADQLQLMYLTDNEVKNASGKNAITPQWQAKAVFYGLAQASGYRAFPSLSMGTYNQQAQEKIQTLLGISTPQAGDYAPIITDSASGPVASFPDGANNLDMLSLVAEIVPIQAGTGDPSPSNVRAISGRGGITVYHSGMNILNPSLRISLNQNSVYGLDAISSTIPNGDLFLQAGTYTFSTNETMSGLYVRNATGTQIGAVYNNNKITFTIAESQNIGLILYKANITTDYWNSVYAQLETGNTAHTFEPYNTDEFLYAWGDTAGNIYGGMIDIVSGVLTVTHDIILFPSLTWGLNSSLNGQPAFYSLNFPSKLPSSSSTQANILSSNYKTVSADQLYSQATTDGVISLNASGSIQVRDFSASTVSEFLTNNANTQLVFEKQTPQTYQLTPQQVQTILGTNNIYSDSGNCSITYRADTKLFILKVIA